MNRTILSLIMLLIVGATTLKANEMILVEDYLEGTFKVPRTETNATVASIEFTLDRDAMVSLATGGFMYYYTDLGGGAISDPSDLIPGNVSWITMNGDSLGFSRGTPSLNGAYFFALPSGSYKFELKVNALISPHTYYDSTKMALIPNPRIQAMIILSDTTQSCVAENPRNDEDTPLPRAIIASGPSIRVPGCSKVVDITGRTVNATISNEEVMIKDLPRGTYFITGNKQNIKLVKM